MQAEKETGNLFLAAKNYAEIKTEEVTRKGFL